MAIHIPVVCPRGRNNCTALSTIKDDEIGGFICCGLNDGKTRTVKGDMYTVCWKNKEIDEISDWDERDIVSTISVMSSAMVAKMNMDLE